MTTVHAGAFECEIVALLPSLRQYAIGLTRSDHLADDLVQDSMERAWRARETFDSGSSLKGWLFRIARNRFIDGYRKRGFTIKDVDGKNAQRLLMLPNQGWCVQYADLLKAINRLPIQAREAVLLVMIGGLSHGEAAEVLGWPLGSLKSRIRRCREQLLSAVDLGLAFESDEVRIDSAAHRWENYIPAAGSGLMARYSFD